MNRGKPAPDLFLATAAAEGVSPAECVVIEDSVPGARAARAAGMDCLGYSPRSRDAGLLAEGAVPFRSMFGLAGVAGHRHAGRGMTLDFLAPFYLWTKAFHVISVIAWMAGIFYLRACSCIIAASSAARPRASG